MKRFFVTIGCMLVMAICAAQSQAELNQNAGNDFKQADKELNQVYQQVLKEYGKQTDFIKSLKASRRYGFNSVTRRCWQNIPKASKKITAPFFLFAGAVTRPSLPANAQKHCVYG